VAAILRITDGTTRISLLTRGGARSGFHLKEWRPSVATYKLGGIWRDSPFSDGRKMADNQWQHPIETITLHLLDTSIDGNAQRISDLRRMLEKAVQYWTTDWQNEIVWIEARSKCETNIRYATLYDARIQNDADPYQQPLISPRSPIQRALTFLFERGHWSSHPPGSSTCVELSAQQDWHYEVDWELNSSQPGDTTRVLYGDEPCGYLFAGDEGDIWRTDDPSTLNNWTNHGTDPNDLDVYAITKAPNGHLFASGYGTGSGRTNVSTDCGANWTEYIAGTPRGTRSYGSLCASSDGNLYLATGNTLGVPALLRTDPAAAALWVVAISSGAWDQVRCIAELDTNRMILGVENTDGDGEVWISDDYWATSKKTFTLGWYPTYLFVTAEGLILMGTSGGSIYSSVDGTVWEERWNGGDGSVCAIDQADDGTVKCTNYVAGGIGGTSRVFVSGDGGYTWNTDELVTAARNHTYALLWSSFLPVGGQWFTSVDTHALGFPEIYALDNIVDLGRAATCDDEVFLVNHRAELNITNVKVYEDGVGYSDEFPAAIFPFDLLPGSTSVDDAVYFGVDTDFQDSGDPPIDNLVFDIGTPGYDISIRWEYYAGAWTTLTVQDGTDAGTGPLTKSGVNSVHWEPPGDWEATDIDGVTALWVRLYVYGAPGGDEEIPTQDNRNVYSCRWPRVDLAAAQVPGTLDALAHHILRMRSDGPNGSGPDLYGNRILVGLRSIDRGADFTAYLNCADEQNPVGIECSLGASTTFINYLDAAPGRAVHYAPTGYQAMAMRVRFGLANTLARQFHGSYRAFLRCRQTVGASGDIRVRLYIGTPWGSDDYWSQIRSIPETLGFNKLIDFGEVKLPLSQLLSTERIATTRIEVHAETTTAGVTSAMVPMSTWMGAGILAPYDTGVQSGVSPTNLDSWTTAQLWYDGSTILGDFPGLYFLDLILIPSDEWMGDFVDEALSVSTAWSNGKVFEIDSIVYPKTEMRGIVRHSATDAINAIYVPLTPGPAMLQPNAQQRLWVLVDKSDTTYTPDWNCSPHIGMSAQSYRVSRYLGMRGGR